MAKPLIVLGITGSIAAVRCFDLCRQLRRTGFDVQVLLGDSAKGIITEASMEFASGKKVISSLTGRIEHVKFFGKKGKADLLLIAPATANTISKIAMGIDDSLVTTFASVAIGSGKPVLLAPAMHEPMYEHPIVAENLEKLKARGVRMIAPLVEEGRAKMADIEKIVFEVQKALSGGKFDGKKILVASGAFREKIDDVRAIANNSSGKLGAEIALACMAEKAEVKLIGNGPIPDFVDFVEAHHADELENEVLRELSNGYDFFFCPAALPDFSVKKREGKIPSNGKVLLELLPREKLLSKVRENFPKLKIIAFKAVYGKTKKEIEALSKDFLAKKGFLAVLATDLKSNPAGSDSGEFFFCARQNQKWVFGTKKQIAKTVILGLGV